MQSKAKEEGGWGNQVLHARSNQLGQAGHVTNFALLALRALNDSASDARECKYGSGAEFYVTIRDHTNHHQEKAHIETSRETTQDPLLRKAKQR